MKTDGVASFIVEESFILQNKAANIKWKRDCWKLTASVISKRSILKIDDDDGALVDVFLRTLNWTGDNHLHLSLIPQILKSGSKSCLSYLASDCSYFGYSLVNLKMNAIAYKFASLKRKRDEEDKEVHEEGAKGDRDENPQKKKKQED